MRSKLLFTLLMSVVLAAYCAAGDFYVSPGGSIQAAINLCSGTSPDTVHVAAGTYNENIALQSYVTLLGGYDGETIIDGGGIAPVVSLESVTDVTIDGFTIQNGKGDYNGGVWCHSADLAIANCIISNNTATLYWGGGIACWSSSVTIQDCAITYNSGTAVVYYESSGTMDGCAVERNTNPFEYYSGGIDCFTSSPTIVNCTIVGNTTGAGGGGISCSDNGCSPLISDCVISGNIAAGWGGGVRCTNAGPTINNCLITGNSAPAGAGMYCAGTSAKPKISNCTIADNTANDYGGAIACSNAGRPQVINSILWANSPDQIYIAGQGGVTMTYSCIQGGWKGTGNITGDPLFVAGPLGDYYLSQTAAGQSSQSPCVNAGSDSAANLGLGTYYTTRTDEACDAGKVDMGYHYDSSCEGGGQNNPPTAVIDSITPNPAAQRQTVYFTGTGTDTDGTVVAWEWSSSINGTLSTKEDFSMSARKLSLGTHTISFRVQDDDGAWSTADTKTLTITK